MFGRICRLRAAQQLLAPHASLAPTEGLPSLAAALSQLLATREVSCTSVAAARRRTSVSPPVQGGGSYSAAAEAAAPPAPPPAAEADDDSDDVQLKLPSDLGLIKRLNPDLHEAMLAHQELQG